MSVNATVIIKLLKNRESSDITANKLTRLKAWGPILGKSKKIILLNCHVLTDWVPTQLYIPYEQRFLIRIKLAGAWSWQLNYF
jgi:hypothetical protein